MTITAGNITIMVRDMDKSTYDTAASNGPAVASLLPQEPVATASAEEVVVVSDSVQDEPHREQEASPYQQPKHRLYCCLHSSSPLRRHGRHW